jgi:hypothetical protein
VAWNCCMLAFFLLLSTDGKFSHTKKIDRHF